MSRLEGYALSPQQKEAWLNITNGHRDAARAVFRFNTAIDWEKLCDAVRRLVNENVVFRLNFVSVPGEKEPVQVPADQGSVSFRSEEVSTPAQAGELMLLHGSRGLHEGEPLLQVTRYHNPAEEWSLIVFSSSPLCCDAWSLHLLAINAFRICRDEELLPEAPLDYLQFSDWENQLLEGEETAQGKAFWKNRMSTPNLPPQLLFGKKGNGRETGMLELQSAEELPATLSGEAGELFAACWYFLLWKLNRQGNFLFGHVHHGRSYEQLYHLTGNFSRLLPLQLSLEPHHPLSGFIRQYADELSLADTHKEGLEATEESYRFAAEQLTCRFQFLDLDLYAAQGDPAPEILWSSAGPLELHLQVRKQNGSCQASLYYNKSSFTASAAAYLLHAWNSVVRQAIETPGISADNINWTAIPAIPEAPKAEEAPSHDLVSFFNRQLTSRGGEAAVVAGADTLTYNELDARSTNLAHYLLHHGYVNASGRVGVLQAETTDLIVSMLAVLKAGGTYIPIDPNDTEKRIRHILADSGISCILSASGVPYASEDFGLPILLLDQLETGASLDAQAALPARTPETPAYIIYTSGTSGLPKGVIISDASLVNYVSWLQQFAGITAGDSSVLLSSYAFDLGYTALWGTLLTGGTLHLVSRGQIQDMDFLVQYVSDKKISFLKTTPSFFNVLVRSAGAMQLRDSALRLVILGGELINVDDLLFLHEQVKPGVAVINHYGPTETTIGTVAHRIDMNALHDYRHHPVIGRAVTNNRVFILDEKGNILPPGLAGEICIAGRGLAAGYLDRPQLTEEKFSVCAAAGERVYRTGDSGAWMPGGTLLYLGRQDDQVKIRGYRVEPGEVRSAIAQYPGIDQAVVTAWGSGHDRQLAAYVTAEGELETEDLKTFLKGLLPDYMVPAYVVRLNGIPLTPNHKVDYKALPDPASAGTAKRKGTPPRNAREADVLKTWRLVLGKEDMGVDDDFFDMGGHSLKAIQLVNRLQKELKIKAAIRDIFNNPTVRAFCEATGSGEPDPVQYIQPAPVKEFYELSHSQKRFWFTTQRKQVRSIYNVPQYCLFTGDLNIDLLEDAFLRLVRRHETLRTLFRQKDGEPVQVILPFESVSFKLERVEAKDREEVSAIIGQDIRAAFDLENEIPIRARIITLAPGENLLLFTLHHIISDGWSREIIYRELMHSYEAGYRGRELSLPQLRIQYKDYVLWHNQACKSHEAYWADFFAAGIPDNEFPLDFSRPDVLTFEGGVCSRRIDGAGVAELKKMAHSHRLTLNSFLSGAYALLLGAYCNRNEVVIGTLVSGRNHADLEGVVGVFINYLPFRISISPEEDIVSYTHSVHQQLMQIYQHQDYPFDLMADQFAGAPVPGRNPVFDTMIVFHEEEQSVLSRELPGGVKISEYEGYTREHLSKLDFKIDVTTTDSGIALQLEYNSNLFKAETMQLLLDRFVTLLFQGAAEPTRRVKDLPVLVETGAAQKLAAAQKAAAAGGWMKVISSFTAEPLEDHLAWWFDALNQPSVVRFGAYHQVFRELDSLVKRTEVHAGECCVLLNRFEDYIQDSGDSEAIETLAMVYDRLVSQVAEAASSMPVIIALFPPMEILASPAISRHIQQLNESLFQALKEKENIYFADLRNYASQHPALALFDETSYRQAYIPFTDEAFYIIAFHINRILWSLKSNACKVIALDCDNTLWEGICGEDGIDNLRIREGHRSLQQFFLQKYNEGFLLTLVSKNNEKDVWQVFDTHPGMVLKKEHFVAWRINWESKHENIRALAADLNLGLDSFAFIDDSPVECFRMMQENPQVLTLELPQDHQHFGLFLDRVISFDKPRVSREDTSRNDMYKAEVRRNEILRGSGLSGLAEQLGLQMSFRLLKSEELDRASQLTLRTNQFNLNGIRRSRQEVIQLLENDSVDGYAIHVRDRFGDYGLTGFLVLERRSDDLFIQSFMLSCRVLGRGVEEAVLGVLQQLAREQNLDKVVAAFRQTGRNIPFSEFLESTGWTKGSASPEGDILFHIAAQDAGHRTEAVQVYLGQDLPEKKAGDPAEVSEHSISAPGGSHQAPSEGGERQWFAPAAQAGLAWTWNKNLSNEENLIHKQVYKALECGSYQYLEKIRQQQIQALPGDDVEEPADELTAGLLKMFREILKNGRIGLNDDFFRTGGQSIKAVQLLSRVHRTFGINISLGVFFEKSTVNRLAAEIIRQQGIQEYVGTNISAEDESYDQIII